MRYSNMLLLFIAAVLSGCNGGFDDTKSKGESKRTDSILKNVRSVDSLRMLVKTYHDSHDTRAEVIAMRELGKRLREESKFSDAIETHRNGLKLAESIKDTNNIIHILNQLGTSYRRIGIMDEAAAYHYRALSYCDVYGNPNDKKILNGIMGFSQLLASMYSNDEQAQQMTEVIEKQSALLAKIIDDILEIADADTIKIHIEECPLGDIVGEAMAMARQVAAPGVSFEYKPDDEGIVASTDRHILQKILEKVLDNAAKFTTQGLVSVLACHTADGGLDISVEDTGPGIPADKAEVVFEQFTKIDEFSQGTGMGLTLCRNLIEKLNGRIYVDTSYTGGCRIKIELPMIQS